MLNIIKGKRKRPQRIVIYGPGGVGKSTWASLAPKPLFLCTEIGADEIGVDRLEVQNYPIIINTLQELHKDELIKEYDTVVLDTIDAFEMYLAKSICQKHQKKTLAEFGYGTGYAYLHSSFSMFLNDELDKLILCGYNVIIIGHSKIRTFHDPLNESYDRYILKLVREENSSALTEWADHVLFANYDNTSIKSDLSKKAKGKGGRNRILHTTHNPAFDAKSRYDLPAQIELDETFFQHLIGE